MTKILGIDVGTNSLGLTVRDDSVEGKLANQIVFSSVTLFKSGVGSGKTEEFSFAEQRTSSRSKRKLYKIRRYRKWDTLKLLVSDENSKYCPLLPEELDAWVKYDKNSPEHHKYPVDSVEFQKWIHCDFGDGHILTPYEIRNELATVQLDFTKEVNRMKLGRAIYNIAVRRGFRSSKGDTKDSNVDKDNALKDSEQKAMQKVSDYMSEHKLPTVGCALYELNKDGNRIRLEYPVVRKALKEELKYIFEFQEGLDVNSDFFTRLISEKKGEGTIFYKRKLQSQKGNVGKCTLEPSKTRCPQSRPEFEEFRTWSFINNIKFGAGCSEKLTLEEKQELADKVFVRASEFKFEAIRAWIEKARGIKLAYNNKDKKLSTINYPDTTPLPQNIIIYNLKKLLGDDWRTWSLETDKTHYNNKHRDKVHKVVYTWQDVWNVCFSADDEETLESFAKDSGLDIDKLHAFWRAMPVQYANLSLKAINNINVFLKKGMIFSDACLLAKLPDIFKSHWNDEIEDILVNSIDGIFRENFLNKEAVNIVNALIGRYKSLESQDRFADHNFEYTLDDSDIKEVEKQAIRTVGNEKWEAMEETTRQEILCRATSLYQDFFHDHSRTYIEKDTVSGDLKKFLLDNFDFLNEKQLDKIYNHSQDIAYPHAKDVRMERDGKVIYVPQLGSPAIDSIRNPMALRVLHTLRRKVNSLLAEGIIDDETRIVVEMTRQLNDANMRWAIAEYQKKRMEQNEAYRKILSEFVEGEMTETDYVKARLCSEQCLCNPDYIEKAKEDFNVSFSKYMDELVRKYSLWKEQGGFSVYTGKAIPLSSVLNGGEYEIEHTVPRSQSFDDSMENKTLCEREVNREKANRLPSELDYYEKIKQNIQPWVDRVEKLRRNVEYWKYCSGKAQTKSEKDKAIRQKHLWRMELSYWQKKVGAFMKKEVKEGFRASQLVDTSIIARYTFHFMKSLFSSVSVQRGSVTSDFRKIVGIQEIDTKKKRENNIHHAIDAFTLTLIPSSTQRDKILTLYYKLEEAVRNKKLAENSEKRKTFESEVTALDKKLAYELGICGIRRGEAKSAIEYISQSSFATYEEKTQALTPSRRRKRVRGKVVPLRDEAGNIVYEKDGDGKFRLDVNGHKIPMAKYWIQGDSIRGNLHLGTNYGAIMQWKLDSNGKIVKDEDGRNVIDDKILYVKRRPLVVKTKKESEGFSSWEDLKNSVVDKTLIKRMQALFPKGTSFKDAYNSGQGICLPGKEGRLVRVRHVRCFAGDVKNPVKVRKQTYLSNKEYKQYYYAKNGENIAMAVYGLGRNRKFKCLSLLKVAEQVSLSNAKNIISLFPSVLPVDGKDYNMLFCIQPGQMVILKDGDDDLRKLSTDEVSKRLHVVKRIFSPNDGRLQLHYHLESRNDNELMQAFPKEIYGNAGANGFSSIDFNNPHPRLLLSLGNQNFWIEGQDFKIINGKVIPLQ